MNPDRSIRNSLQSLTYISYSDIIKKCADGVNIITGDGNINILKALWINRDSFSLNDNIQTKIRKDLGVDEISITECQLEDAVQHFNGSYDYFIIADNCEHLAHLVQIMYNMLNENGKVLVLGTEQVGAGDDYDWEVDPPCGARYVTFYKLLTPIVKDDGIITDLV